MVLQKLGPALIPLTAITTLPAAALAAIFFSPLAAGVVAIVGWLFLLPVTAVLYGVLSSSARTDWEAEPETAVENQSEDPVEKLRQRYARGEIDEQELEQGLDALLETEDVTTDDQAAIERTIENLDGTGATSTQNQTAPATDRDGVNSAADHERDVEFDRE